jgi:Carboxypeptidase regulatory-like domain/TonB-dependent Receptor Plug Domain/TonB dependent receptor
MICQLRALLVSILFLSWCSLGFAQSAQIRGQVSDSSGAVIPKATVRIVNQLTGTERKIATNGSGQYDVPGLDPSVYKIFVQAPGFSTAVSTPITLNVTQNAVLDFTMQVGSEAQSVTVDGSGLQINTTDASVSTVVDRKFVANMPLNGRSFQDLISQTPGVVTQTPQSRGLLGTTGDFSVNGQRTESNYYTVDGVSANTSSGFPTGGPQAATGGTVASSTVLGTTQSLISVDALQEFRVESSTYSAEYGSSPGGQFSLVTRSGTNSFHGGAFDYLRNGFFDANNWFNDHDGLPTTALRQNDFGGTMGGPLWIPRMFDGRNKAFFFVSYEGLRLTQPQAASILYVPDVYMREQAPAAIQPILNAFPLPTNGSQDIDYGTAASPNLATFIKSYSLPSKIDSTSARFDYTLSPKIAFFFRIGYTPSDTQTRTLSTVTQTSADSQSYTLGATSKLSTAIDNEFRLGLSKSDSKSDATLDNFGGAIPINLATTMGLNSSADSLAEMVLYIPGVGATALDTETPENASRQWNLTDSVMYVHGKHALKFGLDYRRIVASLLPPSTQVNAEFLSAQSVALDSATELGTYKYLHASPVFNDTALYAQDEWRVSPRLSLSLGLRWELAPPPTEEHGNDAYTLLGNVNDPSTLSLAPRGTPFWKTGWYEFAPRLGAAWQVNNHPGKETVIRVGGGVFYDTANEVATAGYLGLGFSNYEIFFGAPLPVTPAQLGFSVSVSPPYTSSVIYAFPEHLQLPYTLEWNTSLEQAFGKSQSLTLSYVGSNGRRLLDEQTYSVSSLNPLFSSVNYFPNGITSNYQALQTKFQRSIAHGVQALVSYTWSHSLDFGSNSSELPLTRGNSDFDVRNNLQSGLSWDLPEVHGAHMLATALDNWGIDMRLFVRGGFPVTLSGAYITDPSNGESYYGNVNLIPGRPLYLYGSQYPGGRSINGGPNASNPAIVVPASPNTGDAPRNFLRGFGENQVNLAARRNFNLRDHVMLQFRAEAFNILNHPNFGYIDPYATDATFGQATATLNQSLTSVASQYQQGGPRSMQFALKATF